MLHIPSATSFFFLSSMMVFGNKYLLTIWGFDFPIILIFIQTIVTLFSLYLVNRRLNIIKINNIFKEDFSIKNFKYQYLTALFYSLHTITALKALTGLNIPMYATFKRCGPLFNLMLSYVLFVKQDSNNAKKNIINLSIIMMTIGAIIAGFGDLKFDLKSYLYCGASVIFQAFYLSFIQKCSETEKNSMQTFYYNNLFSLPLLTISFLYTDELYEIVPYFSSKNSVLNDFGFWTVFSLVLICGCCLCFSQFWCTTNNSALTTSVIGVLKSFLQTVVGIYLWNVRKEIGPIGYAGIAINLFFGIFYTYLKYIEKESKPIKINNNLNYETIDK